MTVMVSVSDWDEVMIMEIGYNISSSVSLIGKDTNLLLQSINSVIKQ